MSDKKISQLQIISIGICNIMGTILVSVFVSSVLRHEAWLAGIFGFVAHMPALLIYFSLTKKYPGKGLLQINEAVFGSVAGRLLSVGYLIFFFSLCAVNLLEATNFLSYFILPDTSRLAISALLVAGCAYGIKQGIMPIARVSTIFLVMMCTIILFYGVISLIDAKFEYLLPLFAQKPLDYIQDTHIAAAIPYGETLSLLFLLSDADRKVNVKKTYFAVSGAIAVIMVFIHIREIVSLGPVVAFSTLPTYEAARIVNITGILTRIESLFALSLIMLTFYKTLVLFYICASGITHVTRLKSIKHIIVMLGLLLVVYSVTTYGPPTTNIFFGKNVSPFIWSFFSLGLPLLTLIGALVRNFLVWIKYRKNEVPQ